MPLVTIVGTLLLGLQPVTFTSSTRPYAQEPAQTQQQGPPQEPSQPQSHDQPQPTEPPSAQDQAPNPVPAPAPEPAVPAADEKTPAPPAPAAKPCPEASARGAGESAACKAAAPVKAKAKKRRQPRQAATSNSGKTVVRNGSTAEPTVDISPKVNQQQASKQLEATRLLLAKAEANLKAIQGRQLTPTQQDTVKQIGTYVEQAKIAVNNSEAQRAYNLANKASMLSADLLAH